MRSQQEETLDKWMEVVGRQADKAAAYTRSVVAVGYAVLLTSWAFAGTWMQPVGHAVVGFLLIASVLICVLWEVYTNLSMSSSFADLAKLVDRNDPASSLKAIQEYNSASHRREVEL